MRRCQGKRATDEGTPFPTETDDNLKKSASLDFPGPHLPDNLPGPVSVSSAAAPQLVPAEPLFAEAPRSPKTEKVSTLEPEAFAQSFGRSDFRRAISGFTRRADTEA